MGSYGVASSCIRSNDFLGVLGAFSVHLFFCGLSVSNHAFSLLAFHPASRIQDPASVFTPDPVSDHRMATLHPGVLPTSYAQPRRVALFFESSVPIRKNSNPFAPFAS